MEMRVSVMMGLIFFWVASVSGQSGFHISNHKQQVVIPFTLINNLVFIPITVNGEELTFLLDTGVEETILFSLDEQEQIKLFQVEKIKLKGLGSKEAIDGYQSSKNTMDANGFIDEDHILYLVLDQEFNFSSQIGIPVNGIIGYQFFKNHKIEINYERRKVIVYGEDHPKIERKLKRKYVANPLFLEEKKPYCFSTIELNGKRLDSKLLIDTGNSDALWVFLHAAKSFSAPEKTLHDFLGRGFSGEIYGLRGRVSQFDFGKRTFEYPISTFPDSVSVQGVNFVSNRIGSVGGEVLSRFDLVFDYPHALLYTRTNRKVDEPFNYNMSGIEVEHAGLEWSKELDDSRNQDIKVYTSASDERVQRTLSLRFVLKPVFTIAMVRAGSAAAEAGLTKGDRLISINGRFAHQFTIEQINALLKSEEGRMIKMAIERNGVFMEFKFELKRIL